MKPIRLRIFARSSMGRQVIDYIVYSRKRQRRYALSIMLVGDEQHDRYLVADALKRLRAGWRAELLGADWGRRSAMRRQALREAEFKAKHPWLYQ